MNALKSSNFTGAAETEPGALSETVTQPHSSLPVLSPVRIPSTSPLAAAQSPIDKVVRATMGGELPASLTH